MGLEKLIRAHHWFSHQDVALLEIELLIKAQSGPVVNGDGQPNHAVALPARAVFGVRHQRFSDAAAAMFG